MTTCLGGSSPASPLLVFWEPWCLPTMAWLARLPGFLARRAGPNSLFPWGAWQGRPVLPGPALLLVFLSGPRAKRLRPKWVFF